MRSIRFCLHLLVFLWLACFLIAPTVPPLAT